MTFTDLDAVPRPDDPEFDGRPDPTPRFVHLLAKAAPDLTERTGPGLRTSDAGKCARAIGYRAAGVARTNPIDPTGQWAIIIDGLVRDAWRAALQDTYPDAQINARVRVEGLDATGWADAIVDTAAAGEPWRILITAHTAGGWAYKNRIGVNDTPPEGPSPAHLLEAALLGAAVAADEIVIGYLSTEVAAAWLAEKHDLPETTRYVAEWSYPAVTFMPWADQERDRLAGIAALVDSGQLPARKIPGLPAGAVIVDPRSGRWEQRDRSGRTWDTDTTWSCRYCGWQDVCVTAGAGREPIPTPVTLREAS